MTDPLFPPDASNIIDPAAFKRFLNLSLDVCGGDQQQSMSSLVAMSRHKMVARGIMVWTMAHGRHPRQPRLGEGPRPLRMTDQGQSPEWAGLLDILRRAGMYRDVDSITSALATFVKVMPEMNDRGLPFVLGLALSAGELWSLLPAGQDWVVWDIRALHLYAPKAITGGQLAVVHDLVTATVTYCKKDKIAMGRILDRWVEQARRSADEMIARCLLATSTLGLLLPEQVNLVVRPAGAHPSTPPVLIDWADSSGDSRLGVDELAFAHAIRLARAHAAGDPERVRSLLVNTDNPVAMAYGAAYAAVNMIGNWLANLDTADRI